MTAKELKKKLIEGYRLKDLFHFSDGQDCIIYKSDFEITDDIIYIPDIDLNNCASHSRYFSDELDAQIFYQKKERMFTSGTICAKI